MPVLLTEKQLDAGRKLRHEQQRAQHEAIAGLVRFELERGISKSQIARNLGISRQTVHKIIRERDHA